MNMLVQINKKSKQHLYYHLKAKSLIKTEKGQFEVKKGAKYNRKRSVIEILVVHNSVRKIVKLV